MYNVQLMMERLLESDPAELVEGPPGTLRWAPNDAYAQAHGNKPEYAGRVRGVSKNILPGPGNSHSYYTPSQSRSQNAPPSAAISEMIEKAIQAKEEQHKQQMDELLAKQREMEERLAKQQEDHQQQMSSMSASVSAQMAVYEARFRDMIEGCRRVGSEPEVTNEMSLGSPAQFIVGSSVDSTHGNNILLLFII